MAPENLDTLTPRVFEHCPSRSCQEGATKAQGSCPPPHHIHSLDITAVAFHFWAPRSRDFRFSCEFRPSVLATSRFLFPQDFFYITFNCSIANLLAHPSFHTFSPFPELITLTLRNVGSLAPQQLPSLSSRLFDPYVIGVLSARFTGPLSSKSTRDNTSPVFQVATSRQTTTSPLSLGRPMGHHISSRHLYSEPHTVTHLHTYVHKLPRHVERPRSNTNASLSQLDTSSQLTAKSPRHVKRPHSNSCTQHVNSPASIHGCNVGPFRVIGTLVAWCNPTLCVVFATRLRVPSQLPPCSVSLLSRCFDCPWLTRCLPALVFILGDKMVFVTAVMPL